MTTPTAGSIGLQLDLKVRAGDTLGPFILAFTDSAGAAVDLTGATFEAVASRLDDTDEADVTLDVDISGDPTLGKVELTADETLTEDLDTGSDYFSADEPIYAWRLRMTDSAGNVSTVLFGQIFLAPETLP